MRATCSSLAICLSVPSHAIVSIVIDKVPPAGISLEREATVNELGNVIITVAITVNSHNNS